MICVVQQLNGASYGIFGSDSMTCFLFLTGSILLGIYSNILQNLKTNNVFVLFVLQEVMKILKIYYIL